MLRLNLARAALPLCLEGPGGVTTFLDRADLPDSANPRRRIVVGGIPIGTASKARKPGRGAGAVLLDLPPEWHVVRANAKGPDRRAKGVA